MAPARTVTPEAPLASASTVSLVDVSPSTVMWLKDSFTAAHSTSRKTVGATAASVVMKASMVAMRGWIIPAPLATPARQTDRTPASVRNTQDFENVSVVLMARATSSALSVDRFRERAGSWSRMRSSFSGTPMTPVEATRTWRGEIPSSFAAARALSSEVRSPSAPVQALAFPELTTTARAQPRVSLRWRRESSTGAAATRLVVNMPAAAVSRASEKINARSRAPATFLIPAAMAAARKPRGVARLPSISRHAHMSVISYQLSVFSFQSPLLIRFAFCLY